MSIHDSTPPTHRPDNRNWDAARVNPLDASYSAAGEITVVYDPDSELAWVQAENAVPRREMA